MPKVKVTCFPSFIDENDENDLGMLRRVNPKHICHIVHDSILSNSDCLLSAFAAGLIMYVSSFGFLVLLLGAAGVDNV